MKLLIDIPAEEDILRGWAVWEERPFNAEINLMDMERLKAWIFSVDEAMIKAMAENAVKGNVKENLKSALFLDSDGTYAFLLHSDQLTLKVVSGARSCPITLGTGKNR